ncbi:Uncharacterised protein [Neisseria elongata subsp. glycolytica]|nr:Uncharacterised protein [Neisseria elongata subsp. glycolytica]
MNSDQLSSLISAATRAPSGHNSPRSFLGSLT